MKKEQYKYFEQEVINQRALEFEMSSQGIDFSREHEMPVYYKNNQIGTRRVDFLINGIIAIELKAIIELQDVHLAQAINYLEAYDLNSKKNQGNPGIK